MLYAMQAGEKMRLGTKKIIYTRKSKESKRKFFAFFIIFLIFLLLSVSGVYFFEKIRPSMISLAKTKGEYIAQNAINDAILNLFSDGKVSYKDIVVLDKKEDGSISAVQSNLEGINYLKAVLSDEIQKNIDKHDTASISVPLGTLLGTDFLAGVGPRFNVKFVPYGIANVGFVTEFEDTGINQTRLVINICAETTVGLLMPTVNTSTKVKITIPVIQTIIVNTVSFP